MSTRRENLGKSLESTIASEELIKLSGDVSEALVDSIVGDGLLKEIPIIGTVISLFKVGASFRERHYIKKIYKFLFQLKDTSQKERENFSEKITKDQKSSNEFFEKILYLIDRLDDTEKAEIVGKLFSSLIKGNLKTEDFLRLTSIIDKTYIGDIKYFDFRYGEEEKISREERFEYFRQIDEEEIRISLTNAGLLGYEEKENTMAQERYGANKEMIRRYKLSKAGTLLLEFGLTNTAVNNNNS